MAAPALTSPPATPGPAPEQRPAGVTALGILGIVAGIFWGFLALLALVVGSVVGSIVGGSIGGEAGAGAGAIVGSLVGILFLALAVVSFLAGIGLLARQKWGWYLGLAWALLQILQGLTSLLGFELMSALTGLVLGGLVAWYLLSPRVQAWFRVSHRVPWTYADAAR